MGTEEDKLISVYGVVRHEGFEVLKEKSRNIYIHI